MHVRILAGVTVCGALLAAAQTPPQADQRSLSLPECIELALSRNLDLQIEHLSTDVARYNLNGSYGAYDPTLSFTARRDSISIPSDFDPKKTGIDLPFQLDTDTI